MMSWTDALCRRLLLAIHSRRLYILSWSRLCREGLIIGIVWWKASWWDWYWGRFCHSGSVLLKKGVCIIWCGGIFIIIGVWGFLGSGIISGRGNAFGRRLCFSFITVLNLVFCLVLFLFFIVILFLCWCFIVFTLLIGFKFRRSRRLVLFCRRGTSLVLFYFVRLAFSFSFVSFYGFWLLDRACLFSFDFWMCSCFRLCFLGDLLIVCFILLVYRSCCSCWDLGDCCCCYCGLCWRCSWRQSWSSRVSFVVIIVWRWVIFSGWNHFLSLFSFLAFRRLNFGKGKLLVWRFF